MTQAGTNFSPQTPWINSYAVHDGFLKNKVAQEQLCLHVQGSLIFMSGTYSCNMSHKLKLCKSNTKFLFKTVYFLGVRQFTDSSYIVYNTSGHTNVWSTYVLYSYIQYTYISILYIYLFLIQ